MFLRRIGTSRRWQGPWQEKKNQPSPLQIHSPVNGSGCGRGWVDKYFAFFVIHYWAIQSVSANTGCWLLCVVKGLFWYRWVKVWKTTLLATTHSPGILPSLYCLPKQFQERRRVYISDMGGPARLISDCVYVGVFDWGTNRATARVTRPPTGEYWKGMPWKLKNCLSYSIKYNTFNIHSNVVVWNISLRGIHKNNLIDQPLQFRHPPQHRRRTTGNWNYSILLSLSLTESALLFHGGGGGAGESSFCLGGSLRILGSRA